MAKVLIFSCISAVMLVTAAYGATTSPKKMDLLTVLIEDLEILGRSKDKIDLELYTPDDKEDCGKSILQCYLAEMNTLDGEIEDENGHDLQNIKKNLESLMQLTPMGTKCKKCEANDKKNFPQFHHKLTNFLMSLQKMGS